MELIQRANCGDLDGVKTLLQQGVDVNTQNHCNQTALYLACERGHTEVIQYLLASGASVSLGAKPLIATVRNDHYNCVKLLLEHHADVNCINTKRESPMSIAIQKHYYSIILLLLQYGAIPLASLSDLALELLKNAEMEHARVIQKLIDQNVINWSLENIFQAVFAFAFRCGSVELAERMLSNDSYSCIDQIYHDAVYYSARNNWRAILSKLVDKGVNVNALMDGHTPLYAACNEGHETIVTLLLNNGADPNVENERRVTASNHSSFPLQIAVQQGNVVICNMLLQNSAKLDYPGEPLLHVACSTVDSEQKTDEAAEMRRAEDRLSIVRLLLQHGVDVNAISDEGGTALYCACKRQQLEMVWVLLQAGADVNCMSNRCYPLIVACDAGNLELIDLLVTAGADVKCRNSSNETCLHVLISAYSHITMLRKYAVDIVNVVKLLLGAGADVDARCLREETALYLASRDGHADIVRLLLDAGAETNGTSSCRPLYAACKRGYTEIVDLLLQHGACADAPSMSTHCPAVPVGPSLIVEEVMAKSVTSSSWLPICCAAQNGYKKIIKLLLKHGADVNKKDQLGKSALVHIVEWLTSGSRSLTEETYISKSTVRLSAEFNVYPMDGLSPLHIASSAGMCDLMMELIRHGANCNQPAYKGISAALLACRNGHKAALEVLLRNGANADGKCGISNVHVSCRSHLTRPFCAMVKNNGAMVVEMLLKHGADVNARNNNGDTALSIACETREADACVVELLLKFGADPNIRFPLHTACKNRNTDVAKLLLAYGADTNRPWSLNYFGFPGLIERIEHSPLCMACTNGNVDIVDCLLKNGADAALAGSNKNTALSCAIERLGERCGQQEHSEEIDPIVTLLLQYGVPVNVVNSKGETPLYLASKKGLAGVSKQLLDSGAAFGPTTNNSNKYPLVVACKRGHRDIAVMLLDQGANANVDKHSETPLKLASANGDVELVNQLIHYKADMNWMQNVSDTALHVAVVQCTGVGSKAFVDVVRMLLKCGAGPNVVNDKHETPLYLACRPTDHTDDNVNMEVVQALLEHGANPNVYPLLQSNYCFTIPPLSAACRCGNTVLVILLIKYGAAVNHQTKLGRTALHYAIGYDSDSFTSGSKSLKNSTSTVQVLLSARADPNAVDKTGASPLYLACDKGNTELVQLLLSHGASPDATATEIPRYPVHAACTGHHYDLVKLLLEYNADVSVHDEHGRTAMHCALESMSHLIPKSADGNIQEVLVQLLLDIGCDVNAMSKDGETPFYVACSKGLTYVVAMMLEYGANVDGASSMKRPLNVACREKHVSVVQLLLIHGAYPDVQEAGLYRYCRSLPLHIAAENGCCELVELLLKYGSSIDVTDACGSTALHYAVKNYLPVAIANGRKTAVDVLLENGADVNVLNGYGETPLYLAVFIGSLDVVRKMLQTYGGNPNTSSPEDKNALVTACEKCDVELVDMLLKHGADPNPLSVCCNLSECRLPLSIAVAAKGINHDDIILMLIKSGANVNAVNSEGKTALCIATENAAISYCYQFTNKTKFSTVCLLLEHGASVNVLMPDGLSMLSFVVVSAMAVSRRHEYQTYFIELLQLLVKHGAILSDSSNISDYFNAARQAVSCQSRGVLKDLTTFDGKRPCKLIVNMFRAGAGFQLLASCCNVVATLPGEGRSIHLCQAAVLAGYEPSAFELQDLQLLAASEDLDGTLLDQLVNWLNEDRQRVPSLLRQCRVVIRQHLSVAVLHRSILPAIDKLPLPNSMKMYLQFDGPLREVDLSINKGTLTVNECLSESLDSLELEFDDDYRDLT